MNIQYLNLTGAHLSCYSTDVCRAAELVPVTPNVAAAQQGNLPSLPHLSAYTEDGVLLSPPVHLPLAHSYCKHMQLFTL